MLPRNHQVLVAIAVVVLQLSLKVNSFLISNDRRSLVSTSLNNDHNGLLFLAPQQLGSFETLEVATTTTASAEEGPSTTSRRVLLRDVVSDNDDSNNEKRLVDFEEVWDWQKDLMQEHVDRLTNRPQDGPFLEDDKNDINEDDSFKSGGCDTIIMVEHNPVYTLGTASDEKFIIGTNPDVPVVRMDRGGEVTYHGPGQLVVYPVLDLRSYKQDIHWYMRALEESVLLAINKCGIEEDVASRQEDTTGIWIDDHKVAALGVKCRKWITMHGVAINIESSSMTNFEGIVPCGLEGRKVGHINQFLQQAGKEPITVPIFAQYMKEALEEVFQIELLSSPIAVRDSSSTSDLKQDSPDTNDTPEQAAASSSSRDDSSTSDAQNQQPQQQQRSYEKELLGVKQANIWLSRP